jgi:hypothetical protein
MKSPPVFKLLELALIELEYVLADFRVRTTSLSESLHFVGLESDLISLTAVTRRVLEAERMTQIALLRARDESHRHTISEGTR